MLRLSPQIRLWMLLALVALVGLGLGGYRWWRGRQEMLRMAAWHEWRAEVFGEVPELDLAQQNGLSHEELFERGLENAKELRISRAALRQSLLESGQPIPEEFKEPLIPDEQVFQKDHQVMGAWRKVTRAALTDNARWHAARAKELRSKLFFNLARERERDLLQFEDEIRTADRLQAETEGAFVADYSAYAGQEEALADRLDTPVGSNQADSPPGPRDAAGAAYHRKKAASYRDELARHERIRDGGRKGYAEILKNGWTNYQIPTAPPSPVAPIIVRSKASP